MGEGIIMKRRIIAMGLITALLTSLFTIAPQVVRANSTDVMPMETRGIHSKQAAKQWKDAMVSGNGLLGVMDYGGALNDTFIFNNTRFNVPNNGVREAPDISGVLKEVRDLVMADKGKDAAGKANQAATAWLREYTGNSSANWNIVDTYSFHPGYKAMLNLTSSGTESNYDRWTNYETGEIGVQWSDAKGDWLRRTFVSRTDNVIVTYMENPTLATDFTATVEIDAKSMPNFNSTGISLKKTVDSEGDYLSLKGKYAANANSPLKSGGYAGVTKIVTDGIKNVVGERVNISGATHIALITSLDRQEKDFELNDDKLVDKLLADISIVLEKYTENGKLDYSKMLAPHAEIHGEMMNRVKLDLNGDLTDRSLTSEQLLDKQRANKQELNTALVEKMFNSGRYAYISSSGFGPPRLMGIWTGEFMPQWSGDFTTDANVNLQIAGGNIGNTPEAMEGYFNLIMNQIEEWELNAERIFGFKNAILAPPRTDGDGGALTHFTSNDDFPGQYWLSGGSWLLLPFYEYYLTFGNREIPDGKGGKAPVLDILYTSLTKVGNFFEQLLTDEYMDKYGKYILVPTYSPENYPANKSSTLQPNATMDIASTKDALKMLIDVAKASGHAEDIPKWESLLNKIPNYVYNTDGSLKEWAMEGIEDQNYHRHISHLYAAWPAHEIEEGDSALFEGSMKALDNRVQESSQNAAHGLVHTALVEARLKRGAGVYDAIKPLFTDNYIFTSLMTSHNDNWQSVYCTDASITIPAILMEAFVYSNANSIELLPALPEQWQKGSIAGTRSRNQTTIKNLSWDMSQGTMTAVLNSDINQNLLLSSKKGIGKIEATGALYTSVPGRADTRSLAMVAGKDVTVTISFPTFDTNKSYALSNSFSSMFLQVNDASKTDDAQIGQGQGEIDPAQAWKIVKHDGSYSSIVNVNSGKAIDVYGASSLDSADIFEWDINGKNNQQWSISDASDGYFTIVNRSSQKALTSLSDSTGEAIRQRALTKADNQLWKLNDAGSGNTQIISKSSGLLLKVKHNPTLIVQDNVSFKAAVNQQWGFESIDSEEIYKITNINSGKVLEVQSLPSDAQTIVQQSIWSGGDHQKWKVEPTNDGYFKLTNVKSGSVLQLSQFSLGEGVSVNLAAWDDSPLQKWRIDLDLHQKPLPIGLTSTLKGAELVKVGEAFDLTYGISGLTEKEKIEKLEIVVAYDPGLLEFVSAESLITGLPVKSSNAMAPGQMRIVLEGASEASIDSLDLLKLHLKAKTGDRHSAIVTVRDVQVTKGNKEIVQVFGNEITLNLYASASGIQVTGNGGKSVIETNRGTLQMTAAFTPDNAQNKSVTWSVINLDDTATDKATISASGLLSATRNGQVKVVATANDGSDVKGTIIISLSNQLIKLSGQVFGTGPSWEGCSSCTFDKAMDENISTYFDAANGDGQYVGVDLGEGNGNNIKSIRYYPRPDYEVRMPGGKFQGSNTSQTEGFKDLYTVESQPSPGWKEVTLADSTTAYRYIRYLSPPSGNGNISEIEYYTAPALVIDKSALSLAIVEAQSLHDSAVAGTQPGQYPAAAKMALLAAIDTANTVSDNANSDQMVVDAATGQMKQAIQTFLTFIIGVPVATLTGVDTVVVGQPFDLTVGLSNVTQSVYAQQLTVTYNPNLVVYDSAESLIEGFNIVDEKPDLGRIWLSLESNGNGVNINENMLRLHFRAISIASPLGTNVTINNMVLADGIGEEIQVPEIFHLIQVIGADVTALNSLIAESLRKHDATSEGTNKGQYSFGSKAVLQIAIAKAKALVDNPSVTQDQVSQAISELNAALLIFVGSINMDKPDPNGGNPGSSSGSGSGSMVITTKPEIKDGIVTVSIKEGKTAVTVLLQDVIGFSLKVLASKVTVTVNQEELKALAAQVKEPKGAVVKVQVVQVNNHADILDKSSAGQMNLKGQVYDVTVTLQTTDGSEISSLKVKGGIQLEFEYGSSVVDENLLGIYYLNETTGVWEYVGGTFDKKSKKMSVALEHMGKYTLLTYDKTFSDIRSDHWAYRTLKVLSAMHIINGVTENEFQPNGKTTRAEFTALLVRSLGLKRSDRVVPFGDVRTDAWYASDVAGAYEAGLIQGISDSKFAPNDQVSREQMAVLLVRAFECKYGQRISFTNHLQGYKDDHTVSVWARDEVNKAIASGLMQGKDMANFDPDSDATRAETAEAILNFLEHK